MSNEQSSHSEAVAHAIRALEQSAKPLTITKLEKAIPKSLKSKKDLPEILQQMVKAGQIRSHKARSSVYWLPSLEDHASEKILEALSDNPLTKTDLKNKLRSFLVGWPTAQRDEMVAQLVKSGRIRSDKTSLYWLPSFEDQASAKILEALQELPMTQTDLMNKLSGELTGWPQAKRKETLAQLLNEKRVYKVAPLTGNTSLLSARAEPTPHDYIRLALQLAVARLEPTGLTAEQVMTAAREVLQSAPAAASSTHHKAADLESLILERMLRLNPSAATGAPVQLSQLRHALRPEIADKDIFDQAILLLAEQGRVAVHRQDYVGGLSQEDLAALVSDGRGNYFTGIALKA